MTDTPSKTTTRRPDCVTEIRMGNTVLTVTLCQGLNRQIRRMCRDVGLTILKLRRIAEGPLVLGRLGSGEIRELTGDEIARLKQGA